MPRLLDLFCGAGMGYHQAGFDVVGVDINRQPNYPFEFIQADVMAAGIDFRGFDAIHASPPCQRYTRKAANWGRARKHWIEHPDLVEPVRLLLHGTGRPFVIENVMGAPLRAQPIVLCGTQFGLPIIKHRQFETNWNLRPCEQPCDHSSVYNPWQGEGRSAAKHREAQGTPWIPTSGGASRKAGVTGDLYNAIPPVYTRFIGEQLMRHLQLAEAA